MQVAKYHDTPANLEQALKHMKLQEDEVKYIVITIAERLWASNKLEKVSHSAVLWPASSRDDHPHRIEP